jgi:hypothetical protein
MSIRSPMAGPFNGTEERATRSGIDKLFKALLRAVLAETGAFNIPCPNRSPWPGNDHRLCGGELDAWVPWVPHEQPPYLPTPPIVWARTVGVY